MRLLTRRRPDVLPGVIGTVRADTHPDELLARLRPGDSGTIAVLDHSDLDRAAARALVDAGVVAVVNAAPMLSGRYPSLGPLLLAEEGVVLVDRTAAAPAGVSGAGRGVRDGRRARLHDGELYDGDQLLLTGREVDLALTRVETEAARDAMLAQLDGFTHSSAELLRREQDLIVHGLGLPSLTARTTARSGAASGAGSRTRPAVVVGSEVTLVTLADLRRFAREQDPVVFAVGASADLLHEVGLTAEVVVVCDDRLPAVQVLDAAADVIWCAPAGTRPPPALDQRREQLRPVATTASGEDAALLLAEAGGPEVIVGVGLHEDLVGFLDHRRGTQASHYLTRLKVGHCLVDAAALPLLYTGRVRPRHVYLALLIGLVALAVAVAVTPVGQGWYADLPSWWDHLVDDLRGRAHGVVGTGQ